ncbi:DUF4405 domain-containing protein [Pseudooceanicola sp. CBS1P-1]|uniref:DUF4405 domain-containing protein n=1 Tax=Pseudooceanicola albus TaxID=2692189 RepID=A0A6L7G8Y0_9RHOB|nr:MULTISPECIES: DUF4405 domain-containing protein [Pseudooceanicola]MBT9386508.1 DUF4405 domain-containing protein [Pseudooceanicola endophyticus]MXN20541.1 DUF4405 domain-containing protein [Pseudooceanicola albus]
MTLALRKWATPVTAATFLVTAVTGVVLYFHAGGSLSRWAHIWIGFGICAAALFHIALNWRPAKTYLKKPLAAGILILGVVVTLATSVGLAPSGQPRGLNPGMLFGALGRAPVSALAQISGEPEDALVTRLQQAGFLTASPESTVAQLAEGDQGARNMILALALGKAAQ